mmetsp:Transcript_13666/g.42969  ORF Transcript_13666/g.42969 Transcript_13666/m.42969 type:complete len:208 (-) Transcript_13666:712-1335(-)
MSVSKRSPTMRTSCSSPSKPCLRSISIAWPTMYFPPSAAPPPFPQTRCRSLPSGYISLRNIAENIPGPGSGKPSLVGLKASSAVQTNSAPCERRMDAFLMTSKDQSAYPRSLVFGSTDEEMEPSVKSTTNTFGRPSPGAAAIAAPAIAAHSLASPSVSRVRSSQVATRSAAAVSSSIHHASSPSTPPAITKTRAWCGMWSAMYAHCA